MSEKGSLFLWMDQTGGCDYTIGCGTCLVDLGPLDPDDKEAVQEKVLEVFDYHGIDGLDRELVRVSLVRVVGDAMNIYEDLMDARSRRLEELDRQNKLAEYERLKKELGI